MSFLSAGGKILSISGEIPSRLVPVPMCCIAALTSSIDGVSSNRGIYKL